jgi:membrane protease YdiL (CAAX protease family)
VPATAPSADSGTPPATAPATGPASTQSARVPLDESLLLSVDKAAKSPADRLRAAIVAGEIAGADAALSRLDQKFEPPVLGEDAEALRALYQEDVPLSPRQRDGLLRRHEWFGRLALAYGKPADDPQRREAIRPATRTVLAALSAAGLAGLALLVGVVLLIVAAVDGAGGRLRFAYAPAPPGRSTVPFLEAFAAYIAGMVVISAAVGLVAGRAPAATWFVIAIIPCAFFWPLLRGVGRDELRRGLGWTGGRGVAREVGAGILGYLAGLPVLAAGAVVSFFLQRLGGTETTHPLMDEIGRGGAWRTAQLFFLAAVWAPVVEETMFRGAFYHHLRRRLPWPVTAAFVALVFAAIHPQGWVAIPTLGAIGFCFAAMREWRGSILAPVVAHALNNGMVTVLLLFMVG